MLLVTGSSTAMLGLLVNGFLGSFMRGPIAILTVITAVAAICGCMKCAKCRLRDCNCCKRFLRIINFDTFDDFELVVLVHEALFERPKEEGKLATIVRVKAGAHSVETDASSNSIFQQPLNVTVEQGTDTITVELVDAKDRTVATLSLHTYTDVLHGQHLLEHTWTMKQKGKGIRNPRLKLSLTVDEDSDVEKGQALVSGVSDDVNKYLRLHVGKTASEKMDQSEDLSELEVLTQACTGPLEMFEGLGKMRNVYVGTVGPRTSKRWAFGLWSDKFSHQNQQPPFKVVDLLRIESVQTDAARHHVFVINYFDENRMPKALTLRRIDRARDVWVEILRLLVQKVHESRAEQKKLRQTQSLPSPAAASMPVMSFGPGSHPPYGARTFAASGSLPSNTQYSPYGSHGAQSFHGAASRPFTGRR